MDLKHWTEKEKVLLQTGFGISELGMIDSLLPYPETLPELIHAKNLQPSQCAKELELALPSVQSCR